MSDDNGRGTNPNPNSNSGQDTEGALTGPRSRRKFLRAAVIGTAGVAGVAGVAGIARASGLSPNTLKNFSGTAQNASTPPPPTTITGYFEETGPSDCTDTYYAGNGNDQGGRNRYITFYIANLPAGDYSFDVSQSCDGNTAGPIQPAGSGTSTLQWEYANSSSQVHVVIPGTLTDGCPEDDLGGSGSTAHDSFTVTFHLDSTQNVAIYAHIQDEQGTSKVGGTLASTTTFTGSLSGNLTMSATKTVNVAP